METVTLGNKDCGDCNIRQDHIDGKIKEENVDVDIDILSYAPRVFRFIRAVDKIDEFDIMKSVKPELNRL
jgi:hypothetical protein